MPEPQGPASQKAIEVNDRTALVGFGVIVLLLLLVSWGIWAGYRLWLRPVPSSFALAAYFVDAAGKPIAPALPRDSPVHLRILGDVYKQGQALPAGRVRIHVDTADGRFEQSVSTPLLNGHFQADDPALSSLQPGTPLSIIAEVPHGSVTESANIQLDTVPPTTKNTLYAILLTILVTFSLWFVIAFTGRETARKKRAAIILSYGIIIVFLAVPIFLPSWLLRQFPGAVDQMIGEPAGLVVTCTSSQEPKQHQWALNIGGYSFIPKPLSFPAPPAAGPSTRPSTPAPGQAQPAASAPKPTEPEAQPASPASGSASSPATSQPVPAPVVVSPANSAPANPVTASPNIVDQYIPLASTPGDCRELPSAVPSGTTLPATASAAASSPATAPRLLGGPLAPPLVEVQGGLVVPLYVIILSIIGGAINMTRKVPGFQMEDEASQTTTLEDVLGAAKRNVSKLGTAMMVNAKDLMNESQAAGATDDFATATLAERARQVDGLIDPLLAAQLARREDAEHGRSLLQQLVTRMQVLYATQDDDHPAPFHSYDEWFANHPGLREVLGGSWRVQLLNQYMYLISAPFLAIVTYYLLDLLGLSKPGVVVVLSFSVGLISEKIVSWILGVATGYLRPPKAS